MLGLIGCWLAAASTFTDVAGFWAKAGTTHSRQEIGRTFLMDRMGSNHRGMEAVRGQYRETPEKAPRFTGMKALQRAAIARLVAASVSDMDCFGNCWMNPRSHPKPNGSPRDNEIARHWAYRPPSASSKRQYELIRHRKPSSSPTGSSTVIDFAGSSTSAMRVERERIDMRSGSGWL